MCVCALFSHIPLTWRASILYFFPLLYGSFLLGALILLPSPFIKRPLFACCCLAFALLNILTFTIGQIGVFKRLDAALRGTVVLLVMENLMIFFIATFLLVHMVYARTATFRDDRTLEEKSSGAVMTLASALPKDLVENENSEEMEEPGEPFLRISDVARWWLTVGSSIILIVCSILTSFCLRAVAELQAELDAEAFVEDARHLRDSERVMLLQASRCCRPDSADPFLQTPDFSEGKSTPRQSEEVYCNDSTKKVVLQQSQQLQHPRATPRRTPRTTPPKERVDGQSQESLQSGDHPSTLNDRPADEARV
ncbi:transmembrane protein [Cystoisospora suis]|uniref:Transmembrane protein n=1 Tax=Cystoisospora suis TaxID=483139 RepID=A0A2C6KMH4_9APIC|nr:transmembrane protein [Cystoisospora suis]